MFIEVFPPLDLARGGGATTSSGLVDESESVSDEVLVLVDPIDIELDEMDSAFGTPSTSATTFLTCGEQSSDNEAISTFSVMRESAGFGTGFGTGDGMLTFSLFGVFSTVGGTGGGVVGGGVSGLSVKRDRRAGFCVVTRPVSGFVLSLRPFD